MHLGRGFVEITRPNRMFVWSLTKPSEVTAILP